MKLRKISFSRSGNIGSGNNSRTTGSVAWALNIAAAGAFALSGITYSPSVASADELRIKDANGGVKLIQDVPKGISSDLKVTLEATAGSKGADFSSVARIELSDGALPRFADSDESGIARFKNLPAGDYTVQLAGGGNLYEIATVSVEGGVATAMSTDRDALESSRAMYVVGATAVVGGVGTAIAAGGSSSSNSGTNSSGSLGFVNSDGATAAGGASEAGLVSSAPAPIAQAPSFDPSRPDVVTVSPAPSTGTVNTTPAVTTTPGDPTGGGGVPVVPETPGAPTEITPAPAPGDPMTPS